MKRYRVTVTRPQVYLIDATGSFDAHCIAVSLASALAAPAYSLKATTDVELISETEVSA